MSMQIIDLFIGSNIPYLCVTFICANGYQITLRNNTKPLHQHAACHYTVGDLKK